MIPNTYSLNKTFVPVINTFASIDIYDPQNINECKRLSNIIYELSGKNINDPIDPQLLSIGEIIIHSSMVFTVPWLYSFNSNLTSLRIFYSKDGTQLKKKMMTLIGKKLMFAEDNINRLIELPLSISGYKFGVLVNKQHKLPDVTFNQLLVYIQHLQETEVGEFTIPLFMRVGRTVCDSCLNNMACKLTDLQLTNLFPFNNSLNISKIYQTLIVRGLEKGAEKYSKYDVPIGDPNYRSVNLTIDSPFIYYLRHLDTNQIIFSGVYH
jgi:serine protease inhibitor